MSYSSNEATLGKSEAVIPPEAVVDARKTEIEAFEKATRSLIDNKEKEITSKNFIEAIELNKLLWRTLETDLASKENQLPDSLKAKLISVAMWVEKHSLLAEKGEARVDSLIEVNQSIIKGLIASTERE
ncbi:MAG: hypothetical protein CFH01_01770 [Alphaproteobacteria bacterium MarineAlpha2_Bin1]|nr:MAG: hypothetical protein CFH01_01770 [Alphaproteobacteria bacterium MarineAlpha2_Bin1]|tara:strand:+ start:445 stop:831 length:387 start_codon:yes stop_codon:yes gene_type:complete